MGRQDGFVLPSTQYIHMPGQQIYAIRVQNHRTFRVFQHRPDHHQRPLGNAQPAARQHRVHGWQALQNLGDCFPAQLPIILRKRKHHRFIQLSRFYGINALRDTQVNQSRPSTERTHGSKVSRPGEAPAAAQQQYLSKSAFVPEGIPIRQRVQNAQPVQFQNCHSITRFFR